MLELFSERIFCILLFIVSISIGYIMGSDDLLKRKDRIRRYSYKGKERRKKNI